MWCLNCCAAPPNAACNTDPELLLMGGGTCKTFLGLGQSQERWRCQSSWELKEQMDFHPKEYLLTFNTLTERTYLPSLVMWRACYEFAFVATWIQCWRITCAGCQHIHPVLCWQDSSISGMSHVLLLKSFCTRSWTDLHPVVYLCIYNALGHL